MRRAGEWLLTRLSLGWVARWVIVPTLAGVLLASRVDLTALPVVGPERLSAVFLSDGSAYYGHVESWPWSGTVTLHEAYYLQEAPNNTGLQLALVRRGTELHEPAAAMRIPAGRILAIERVGAQSPVAQAIAVDRVLRGHP